MTVPPAPPSPGDEERTIAQLVARLIDSAEAFVRAEIALYRAEAAVRVERARLPMLGLAIAGNLGLAATIVGLIALAEALAPALGRALATGLAMLTGIVLALLIGLLAWRALVAAIAVESERLGDVDQG